MLTIGCWLGPVYAITGAIDVCSACTREHEDTRGIFKLINQWQAQLRPPTDFGEVRVTMSSVYDVLFCSLCLNFISFFVFALECGFVGLMSYSVPFVHLFLKTRLYCCRKPKQYGFF